MTRRCAAALLALSLILEGPLARAQAGATEQAKTLFDAGAEAYQAGNFPAAIQAFESAYKLAPRPGIMFSMAQAHRRQYYIDKRAEHLREAIRYYREYVARVAQGGRRGEAAQALAELEPVADRLDKDKASEPAARLPPDTKPETRLMILSKVTGAQISVDGAAATPMPLFSEVKPGKHALHVSAEGYFPEDREVEAREGVVVTLDVPLQEMPGLLSFKGADGAQVMIDERLSGTLPTPKPIEVPAGSHVVAITKSGYKVVTEELEIERGQSKSIPVKLEMTGQRVGSYVLMAAGAAGFAASAVLGIVAGVKQRTAQDISDRATKQGGVPAGELTTYTNALTARDTFRGSAGAALVAGGLVGGTGFLLFLFDVPVIQAGKLRGTEKTKKPVPSQPRETPMEMSAIPIVGPGLYGVSLSGSF